MPNGTSLGSAHGPDTMPNGTSREKPQAARLCQTEFPGEGIRGPDTRQAKRNLPGPSFPGPPVEAPGPDTRLEVALRE
eukprot:4969561-Pyramimonas_sp.AAC.1